MRTYFLFLIAILLINSCSSDKSNVKYDSLNIVSHSGKRSYSSVIRKQIKDTLYNYYYFRLDSNYNIDNKKISLIQAETFTDSEYYLYDVVQLKLNAIIKDSWKTPYEKEYYDSLTVKVLDVISDTSMNGININTCYIYEMNYNPLTRGEDYMDYVIYFDVDRRIPLKKEYYLNGKLKGTEEIVSISYIQN